MSDEQKIWFVYLTDHHEGPFTPAEVAEKVVQAIVTPQSLAWKDGMPEWVPLESIPELAAALSASVSAAPAAPADAGTGPSISTLAPAAGNEMPLGDNQPTLSLDTNGTGIQSPAVAPAAAGGDDGFSLAQLLSNQQTGAPVQEEPSLTGASSVLASQLGSVQSAHPMSTGSLTLNLGVGAALPLAAASVPDVHPDDEVWTMRVGTQVSGLHSMNILKDMASKGQVPADAAFWRAGWADFQPLAALPDLAAARKPGKGGAGAGGRTGLHRGFAPITASANVGDDEPTDPAISSGTKSKIRMVFDQVTGLLKVNRGSLGGSKGGGSSGGSKFGGVKFAPSKKMLAIGGGVLGLAALGAGAYFLLFSSSIPSDLDVSPADLHAMKEVVGMPKEEGGKFHAASALGTGDEVIDDTSPRYYVATNLPQGTELEIKITGRPGTLVNRMSIERVFRASVGPNHFAIFEKLSDEGDKPLPMGKYTMRISAEGSEPLQEEKFLGGKSDNAAYKRRLTEYQNKVKAEFDDELKEIQAFLAETQRIYGDLDRKIADFKAKGADPKEKTRLLAEWNANAPAAQQILYQQDQKLRAPAKPKVYHARAFLDMLTVVGQVYQLLTLHQQRLTGATPAGNPDEVQAQVAAGLAALEQWYTSALLKNPFELQPEKAPAAAPAAGAAPATAPAAAP